MEKSIEELKAEVCKSSEFVTYKKALEALSNTPAHIAYKKALDKKDK
jgi:hypothetical protein